MHVFSGIRFWVGTVAVDELTWKQAIVAIMMFVLAGLVT